MSVELLLRLLPWAHQFFKIEMMLRLENPMGRGYLLLYEMNFRAA